MAHADSYAAIVAASERVAFRVDEVLPEDASFDFAQPFLPEALARTRQLEFLSAAERRLLNQVRGHTYLGMFGLVEEFILPFVLDHVRAGLDDDDLRTRALLSFAGEEAKHIQLFKRFRSCFLRAFPSECELVGPAHVVASEVLSHAPLAVALLILHIEWMTQRHYVESARDETGLEPRFKELLRVHWLEEAQHAKLDAHVVRSLASALDAGARERAVEDYVALVHTFDGMLAKQVELDTEAMERASGRRLSSLDREAIWVVQQQANRWTYLGSGMTHPQFMAILAGVDPDGAAHVAAVARQFC